MKMEQFSSFVNKATDEMLGVKGLEQENLNNMFQSYPHNSSTHRQVTANDVTYEYGGVYSNDTVGKALNDFYEELNNIGVNNGLAQVTVTYGEELSGGTWSTDGWTAITDGYQHITGNTIPLSLSVPTMTLGKLYQIQFTASDLSTSGTSEFYVSAGGSPAFETYKGGGVSQQFDLLIFAGSSNTAITITPRNVWVGSITDISVKEITSHNITQVIAIKDNNENIVLQARTGDNESIYLGAKAGENAITGELNIGIGYESLTKLTSGYWNSAVGAYALQNAVNGSRNVAIGYTALKELDSGDRNIAIGTFSQRENISGRNNVSIGADSMQFGTNSYNNIGVGTLAQARNQGHDSIAIGYEALHNGTSSNSSIAIGTDAMKVGSCSQSIGIGYEALRERTGGNNVAIGHLAGKFGTTGSNNVFLGFCAGIRNNGNNNVVIGAQSIPSTIESSNNKVIIGNADTEMVILGNKKLSFNQDGTVTWEVLS